mgnify:CR=1 FL=1
MHKLDDIETAGPGLQLADQIEARLEGFGTRLPFRGADLVAVLCDELARLDQAKQLIGIAADAVISRLVSALSRRISEAA